LIGEQLIVRVGADIRDFNRSLGTMSRNVQAFGIQAMKVGGLVTAAFTGIGLVALKRFADVDKSVREIVSLMDDVSSDTIPNLTEQVKQLSVEFGKQKETIAGAQYQIVSAGFRGMAESSTVLRNSLKLATAGLADTEETADLMTSTLNAYHLTAKESARVSDIFFQTVKQGKTTLSELAGSLGEIMQPAYAAKVSLEEVAAAVATTTVQGINTAESATAIKNAIISLAAPAPEAAKKMKELGIQVTNAAGEMLPLLDVMKQFEGMSLAKLRELIPNIRAAKAVLALANNYKTLEANVKAMTQAAGSTQKAFEVMADSPAMRIQRLKQILDNLLVSLGEAFLPILEDLTRTVGPVVKGFADWVKQNKELVGKIAKTVAIVGGLVTGIGAVATVLGMLTSPVTLTIGLVTALGYVVYKAVTSWDTFKKTLLSVKDLAQDIGRIMMGAIGYSVSWIMLKIGEMVNWIVEKLDWLGVAEKLGIKKITENAVEGWRLLNEKTKEMMDQGISGVSEKFGTMKTAVGDVITAVTGKVSELVNNIKNASVNLGGSADNIANDAEKSSDRQIKAWSKLATYVNKHVKEINTKSGDMGKKFGQTAGLLERASARVGESLGENIGKGIQGARNALKGIIDSFITALQAAIFTAKGMAFVKSIFSFGTTLFADMASVAAAFAALAGARAIIGSFHSGGVIGGNGEVLINALPGEGVVNRKGMDILGKRGLEELNSGQVPSLGGITLQNTIHIGEGNAREVSRLVEKDIYETLRNLDRRGKISGVKFS
jgi:TP901 family phage tail tape measure protein